MASACGRPPGCVQPRPTTMLFRTAIAATAGLGRLSERARSASAAAAASQRASVSVCTRGGSLLLGKTSLRALGPLGASGFFCGPLALGLRFHGFHVEARCPAERLVRLALALGAGLLLGADTVLKSLVLDVRGDDLVIGAIGRERGDVCHFRSGGGCAFAGRDEYPH